MIKYDHEFSTEKINEIKSDIDKALAAGANPIAAFDADGTLWSGDMGENFLNYELDNDLLKGYSGEMPEDPVAHYFNMKVERSPQEAYLWLAQINEGNSEEDLKRWSRECAQQTCVSNYLTAQKEIITYLKEKGVEVYVVTASIKWAVMGAAEFYDIPNENILGVQVEVDSNGKLTSKQKGPITWREGKVEAILEETGGKKPFFCAGNTMGDIFLLEASTDIRLVLSTAYSNEPIVETEDELIEIAKEKNWFYHVYQNR